MPWSHRVKRRLTFTLRGLFASVLIVSLPLAWFGYQYRLGERAERYVQQLGGTVSRWWYWDLRWGQAIVARLHGTPVSDADLPGVAAVSTLGALDLSDTSITDDGLRHLAGMRNLSFLDISDTSVTDRGLEHLKRMPRLSLLQAHRTKITDEEVEKLKQAIPGLDVAYGAP